MIGRCRRVVAAAFAALLAVAIAGTALPAQQAVPASSAPGSSAAGPRQAPVMRPAEPIVEPQASSSFAPTYKKKDTTTITISTVGLVLIIILLIILLA